MPNCPHGSARCGTACSNVRSDPAFQPLSTRLFPKFEGADAYALTGIAARCDWVVLSDRKAPFVADRVRTDIRSVQTVFVSMRAHEHALAHFFDSVLPQLTSPFVLVTGSEDITLPRQIDQRWPSLDTGLRGKFAGLLDNPLLVHWFCENLDEKSHPRQSPLPLGMVYPHARTDVRVEVPEWGGSGQKHPRILCAHRVRDGGQWEPRRRVTELAKSHWRSFVTVLEEPVDEAEFEALIRNHAFVLCVEGGGLDPSPKAWQTLLNGSIPVMRRTAVSEAYTVFPSVQIDDWAPEALSADKLDDWFDTFYRNGYLARERPAIIERLGIDYWWRRIQACLAGQA